MLSYNNTEYDFRVVPYIHMCTLHVLFIEINLIWDDREIIKIGCMKLDKQKLYWLELELNFVNKYCLFCAIMCVLCALQVEGRYERGSRDRIK